ncbi:hypothetical protein SPRG_19975 [Saprolegnia parasitica CBS 223.65]|uniref:Uncharacterized protein n=1 Tax=Saprolegnia parasitica (strain CBS 223.65) TaxID=695850 RepID=A0A067CQG7_SAPPC|nr:hypothetical protein SPRG_19975 [Saprolegnia parasitica CBS 223.65]KDO28761.1 hypothetical protein SPRG_19975 [Saprolegnia parasitica CBS 223.65]|eukprot:XP_012200507.1 hypothetical protein SPRG_19975 [Saprolegnia parasitica CBS 223.65]
MGTHQEPSESTTSEPQDAPQGQASIPPGARTSESELPQGIAIPILEYSQLMKKPALKAIDLNNDDEKTMTMDDDDDQDYVDPTLFSPEVSRHSIEVAVRRARSLELELRDMAQEVAAHPPSSVATDVSSTLLTAVKRIVGARNRYSLLDEKQASADAQMVGESDNTDGDGMQLSPVSNGGDVFKSRLSTPSVLRKISAYGHDHAGSMIPPKQKKRIMWRDTSTVANGDDDEALVPDHEVKITISDDQTTMTRPPKRANKQKTGVIRRLSPKEKEELYELRPDLKIVPNWAQKYREEMTGAHDSVQCNNWLVLLILFLICLLVFLFYMISQTKPEQGL